MHQSRHRISHYGRCAQVPNAWSCESSSCNAWQVPAGHIAVHPTWMMRPYQPSGTPPGLAASRSKETVSEQPSPAMRAQPLSRKSSLPSAATDIL